MQECFSCLDLFVNAEVDSMGGVLDGGIGIATKTSPSGAAIEKAQSELRKEYDVRDERRRELEFLEKGGDPLDFKLGQAASVSVQSTSHPEHHPEQVVTSAVKVCSTFDDSHPGDSIKTSGRLGVPTVYEPNSADNLLLFDGENELLKSKRNPTRPHRRNDFVDSSQIKESEDCAIFRPYARRNRSKSNRDLARSSSTDTVPLRGNDSSIPSHQNSKETILETNNQKDQNKSSNSIPNPDHQLDMEIKGDVFAGGLDVTDSKGVPDNEQYQCLKDDTPPTFVDGDHMIRPDIVSSSLNRDRDSIQNEAKIICAALRDKKSNPELSCTQISLNLEGTNESILFNSTSDIDDSVILRDRMLALEGTRNLVDEAMVKENNETRSDTCRVVSAADDNSVYQKHKENHSIVINEEMRATEGGLQNVDFPSKNEVMETNDCAASKTDGNPDMNSKRNMDTSFTIRPTMGSSFCDTTSSGKGPNTPGLETCDNHSEMVNKAREDFILEEARVIEAKRKRISELSVGTLLLEKSKKSQWDFVLEEMAWLANDFAQERLWKRTIAFQISKQVASSLRPRFKEQNRSEEQSLCRKRKKVASTLASAVMHFWRSVEELVNGGNPILSLKNYDFDLVGSTRDYGNEVAELNLRESNMETSNELGLKGKEKIAPIKAYGVRFLKYNKTIVPCVQSKPPPTPDKISDLRIQESLSEDHFMEESIFYKVSFDAMEIYRKSIESLILFGKIGSSMMQTKADTSMYDDVQEFSQENAYEEERQTNMYYYTGTFEGSNPSKISQKKRNNFKRADLQYGHGSIGSHKSISIGKRPANNHNVGSIPTKRVRTASRQRVQSTFSNVQSVNKTEASSGGDTDYFQDEHSTMHSGSSQFQRNLEVEPVLDFEKFDSREMLTKPRKKKKSKHLNSTYEERWQLDSIAYNEQRDTSKKRLVGHNYLESNGSSGLYGQHNAKKLKILKQSLENFDNISPMTGSIPSPAASQMSNMSNTNKFMKLIGVRDRGKKPIELKMPEESPWSLFEDQALVVLVHDMGPNWELVSDAINTTLQFKCLFRKPKECKERHKNLMEEAGDGEDSSEDSGSFQPYPSTLPGIPKGSARQLFQHLQGPMEEDTLKSHFEKIISIGKKQHYLRSQNDNRDMKQIAPVHNSHMVALASKFPNNLKGGFLTPLELCALCDVAAPNIDANTHGFQGPHPSGLSTTNQSSPLPVSPNSSLQGSSSLVLGSNMASPSGPNNSSIRDGRFGLPRTSLPIDEHQRLQQYNSMISGRNIQQSNTTLSGAISGNDRGTRMPPGGNGMSMANGMNRGLQMSKTGFQGIASSSSSSSSSTSILNSGRMHSSSGMVRLPSPGTMHPGASSGQGNSVFRPREALHMVRPGQTMEHQRQAIPPELHTSQGVSSVSSPSANQTTPVPSSYPLKSSQQHQLSAQLTHTLQNSNPHHLQGPGNTSGMRHPAYAQLKERQLQQQRMMQQHQQRHFATSNALMPHVQPPLGMQNDALSQQASQLSPSLTPSSPNMTPVSSQIQQKMTPNGVGWGPQSGPSGLNHMGKQRQKQAQQQRIQQSGRQHPQQPQQALTQAQSQEQAKLLKGMGRGNMLMHQNLSIDPSHLNGNSTNPVNQVGEKGEQAMHSIQGQSLHSGSGTPRPIVPHQKLSFAKSPTLSKQLQQSPSTSDNGSLSHVPLVASGSQGQTVHQPPPAMTPNHHHQRLHPQSHQKQETQQNVQRVLHQNHQSNSDMSNNSVSNQSHPDQLPVNNNSHIGTSTTHIPVESVHDSVMQNSATSLSSTVAPPLKKPSRSNSISQSSQGILHRQFSGGLPPQAQPQSHLKQALGVVGPPTQKNQQEQVEESQEQKSTQ